MGGESSKFRGDPIGWCFWAGLEGGGVKRRGCLRGGDSQMEGDSVVEEENERRWRGDWWGVAKLTLQPCRVWRKMAA